MSNSNSNTPTYAEYCAEHGWLPLDQSTHECYRTYCARLEAEKNRVDLPLFRGVAK